MFKLKTILPVVLGLVLISSSFALAAPAATPGVCTQEEQGLVPGVINPGCLPPINVSTALQKKDGPLNLGSLLVINSASVMGKLGIGAASPIPNGPKLYIQDTGTGFLTLAMLKNTNLAGSSAISFNSGGADAFWGINGPNRLDANPNQVFMGNGNANGGFLFFTGGGAVANERMRITSTGNVGIGTTNPTTKLTVNGSITIADGTQGVGKVLTSDADGKASWGAGEGSLAGKTCPSGQAVNGFKADGSLSCFTPGGGTGTQGLGIHNYYGTNGGTNGGCLTSYSNAWMESVPRCSSSDQVEAPMTCKNLGGWLNKDYQFTCPAGYKVLQFSKQDYYANIMLYGGMQGKCNVPRTVLSKIVVTYICSPE